MLGDRISLSGTVITRTLLVKPQILKKDILYIFFSMARRVYRK